MRTILFRGKTINDHGMLPAGSWITGGYYMDDCYGGCPEGRHYILTWNSGGPGGFMDRCEVERKSVGQYTGLCDRNGKGIYEGDIFENLLGKYVVRYEHDGFYLHNPRYIALDSEEHCDLYLSTKLDEYLGEVIGNRYENPDLLGETDDAR
jgi:hypothetical protein